MADTHKLADIKGLLLSGQQPMDLVRAGHARTSVYYVARKLREAQLGQPGFPPGDEVSELRRRKEIIRLEKEIAELEAAREKLPDRVAALEGRITELEAYIDGPLLGALEALAIGMWSASGQATKDECRERGREFRTECRRQKT